MGLLDIFRRGRSTEAEPAKPKRGKLSGVDDELFDEAFQRRLEHLALISKRVFSGAMKAERRTKKTGSGVEFADHRNYTPGDDFRYLDWHAYQRFDKLLLRLFEEEEDLSIYFIVDASWSMGFGDGRKLRYAKQLCAALAYVGLANLDRVTIVAAGAGIEGRMQTTRSKARIFRVFRFLSALKSDGPTDLEHALRKFVAQHKRRGLAVLITDLYDPAGFEKGINVLRYNKFEPFVLHVQDHSDGAPDLKGDLVLFDCETGEEREVTVTKRVLAKYQEAYTDYLTSIERFCASRRVAYFSADVEMPFDELILRVFRRGGFLR